MPFGRELAVALGISAGGEIISFVDRSL
jgi:hypothetical protein